MDEPCLIEKDECGERITYRIREATRKKLQDAVILITIYGVPRGIRTPVAAVKGRCPGPLDDGDN
jgi:hypothetical protein